MRLWAATARDERGQTSAEYIGMILVIAAVIAVIGASGIAGTITDKLVSAFQGVEAPPSAQGPGGGEGPGGGPGATGPGAGGPGGGSDGRPGAPGTPGTPGGPGGDGEGEPRRGGDPDGAGGLPVVPTYLPCYSSTSACRALLDQAKYVVKTRPGQARTRMIRARQELLRSGARSGTPEYERLENQRLRAKASYEDAVRQSRDPRWRRLDTFRQGVNPRTDDLTAAARRALGRPTPTATPPPPRPSSASAARRVLDGAKRHLPKIAKGTAIVGTALAGYTNIQNEGVAKGLTQTTGQVGLGYFAGSVVATGCAALLVTGPGALACGAGVVVAAIAGSELGKWAGGAVYDNVLKPGFDAAKDIGGDIADGVASAAQDVKGKAEDVAGFLGF